MTSGHDLIVEFSEPPIVEVVAGIAFDGLGPETGPYLAAFWSEQLRPSFPRVEQQPPYTPPREVFHSSRPSPPFKFELMEGVPPTRLWASSPSGEELIQVQPGWFACNWRKLDSSGEYDHWPSRREVMGRWFSEFTNFAEVQSIGTLKVTQCEVTYVNHIQPNALWSTHADANKIFTFGIPRPEAGALEQLSTELQVALLEEGTQWGRLYVKVVPAYGKDGRTPLYVLELTVRGPVQEQGDQVAAATAFLDKGRGVIVRSFVELTTEEMQTQVWGKRV